MTILPDSSVLIPYFARHTYVARIEGALRTGHLALCSIVAAEIMAGARDQEERRGYDRFFERARRLGLIVTPNDEAWRRCGRILSRYRERYGQIHVRDHQNDVLIVLTAIHLAHEVETTIITENDAHLNTWLSFVPDRSGVRVEAMRR